VRIPYNEFFLSKLKIIVFAFFKQSFIFKLDRTFLIKIGRKILFLKQTN